MRGTYAEIKRLREEPMSARWNPMEARSDILAINIASHVSHFIIEGTRGATYLDGPSPPSRVIYTSAIYKNESRVEEGRRKTYKATSANQKLYLQIGYEMIGHR